MREDSTDDVSGCRAGVGPGAVRPALTVAGRIARWYAGARKSGRAVRVPVAAVIFALCVAMLAAAGERPLTEWTASRAASSAAICPVSRATYSADRLGLWAAGSGQRRTRLRPAGCRLLLMLFLLSGDIETNPGPALRVFSQNVCSLKNKLGTLRTHAVELADYDAICLTETWLNQHVTDSELKLGMSDFTWFRADRDGRGGGVACAVKSRLSPVHRPELETDCESLVLQLGTTRSAYLAVCYRPPDADRQMEAIANLLRGLHRTGRPFLMVGDLNLPEIDWSGDGGVQLRRRTARAVAFVDVVAECGAVQSVTSATRGDNILDLAVSCGGNVKSDVGDRLFTSDHSAVATYFMANVNLAPCVTRTKVYNYKRADFAALRQSLRLLPWGIMERMDVDTAVDLFYDLVFAAISDHIPMLELRKKFPPWFSRRVRELLREKERAHKRKKADPSNINVQWHSRARASFKREAASSYRDYLKGLMLEFKDNPKRYWTFIKSLKSSGHVSPVLECSGSAVKDATARADCLNKCFSNKFSTPYTGELPDAPDLNAPGLDTFHVPPGRVAQFLRELSPHKACGPDGLSARILHECADELAIPLDIICRLSVTSGVFPAIWKRANIIPVFKKGSKKLPDNYRPVSLLSICSKILEKVVWEELLRACLPALPSSQHGFLPQRSCITNLACFMEHCWTSLSGGSQTDTIYTDYSSAFTSVSHRLLLHKLRCSFNLSGTALDWIESYLNRRSQRVIVDGKYSEWSPVLSGVPEGSILGPILFTCYVADLPQHINSPCLSYADDVKIFKRVVSIADAQSLQSDLDRLSSWSKTWCLKLNPAKCSVISFTLRTSPHLFPYVLDGHQLQRCLRVRDLGVILDCKLSFADHIDTSMIKANRMVGLLMRSMQVAAGAPRMRLVPAAVIAAYKAHVRPLLEYGSVIWSGAAITHLRRLERLQHRFLAWLKFQTQAAGPVGNYESLLSLFRCPSMRSRLAQADIMFARSVFSGRLDCPDIVGMFSLSAPSRRLRRPELLNVPRGRVDSVRRGFLVRLPQQVNSMALANPDFDLFFPSFTRSDVAKFADRSGTFLS